MVERVMEEKDTESTTANKRFAARLADGITISSCMSRPEIG